MRKKQSGAAVLFVVTALLLAVLIMLLGSYKSLYFRIKRANNHIESRQEHWLAEGALECTFAKVQQERDVPSTLNDCRTASDLDSLTISSGASSIITATKGYRTLRKTIKLPSFGEPGAIKSTSDLIINGSYTSSPDPGRSLGNNEWECTSVVYESSFYANNVNTYHPYQLSHKPYAEFPDSSVGSEQNCASSHYSWDSNVASSKSDYRQSSTMEPFEDIFDVSRGDWFDVMSNSETFSYVPNSLNGQSWESYADLPTPVFNSQCGRDIVSNIERGSDLIWVYGGCEITTTDFQAIEGAIDSYLSGSGIILVVQDGILSTKGTQNFTGLLYHFISPEFADPSTSFAPDFLDCSNSENNADLEGVIDTVSSFVSINKERVSYFQHGSFNPLGGFVMDAPGTFALFNTSLSFKYNRDVIKEPKKKLKRIHWQRGSWNDL
ncbi:hypothetical protein GT360_03595 [Vibrio astriarenae]|uniref:Uncharacterized protein n=1 Tax=Vibrio astriarenae TaxID=1481923 RepID=A0A7Z2T1I6_9VIBR|nr:hypothetical protein [Vibrio astriarenae]QIA62649.1 hypothetical protein GT360_03595 [Vibrio astriarenae]